MPSNKWGGGRRLALGLGLCCCLALLNGCVRKTAAKAEAARSEFAANAKRLELPLLIDEPLPDDTPSAKNQKAPEPQAVPDSPKETVKAESPVEPKESAALPEEKLRGSDELPLIAASPLVAFDPEHDLAAGPIENAKPKQVATEKIPLERLAIPARPEEQLAIEEKLPLKRVANDAPSLAERTDPERDAAPAPTPAPENDPAPKPDEKPATPKPVEPGAAPKPPVEPVEPAPAADENEPPKAKEKNDAPRLALESTVLRSGANLRGSLSAALPKGSYHLLWTDTLGRVVWASELDPKELTGEKIPFSFARPAGTFGEIHTLALVRLAKGKPGRNAVYETITQVSFRVPQTKAAGNYLAICDGIFENADAAFWQQLLEKGINAGLSGAEDNGGVFAAQNMFSVGDVAVGRSADAAYARARNAGTLQNAQSLFDDATLAAAKKKIHAVAANKTVQTPALWSLGDSSAGVSPASGSSEDTRGRDARATPHELDMSPQTLAIFRAWLEEKFSSVANLNTRWGTHYSKWEDVRPPTTDEVKIAHNKIYAQRFAILNSDEFKKGAVPVAAENKFETRGNLPGFELGSNELRAPGGENFAAWTDWREFHAFAVARILREYRADVSPLPLPPPSRGGGTTAALSGASGLRNTGGPSAWGWDWTQIAKSLDWVESDSVLARELARSFSGRQDAGDTAGKMPALQVNSGIRFFTSFVPRNDAQLFKLWDGWLRGDSGCFVKQPERWAAADAPENETSREYLSDLPLLTQGLTQLRDGARRVSDPVAIYYSPRSLALHWMIDSEADGAFWLARSAAHEAEHGSGLLQLEAWQALLEDLGYAPRFVQPAQLLAGDLRKGRTKLLILPKVLSLSEEEARAIREFAKNGGVVIADGECGTFDGGGKREALPQHNKERAGAIEPRALGALDKDFGIARRDYSALERNGAFNDAGTKPHVILRGADDGPSGPVSSQLRVLEPSIVPSGSRWHAASEGGAPAMLVKAAGSGRFVYLNLALQDYVKLSENQAAPDFQYSGMSAEQYAARFGAPRGGEAIRLVLGDLLSEVAPENPLKVRYDDGTPVRGVRRTRLALGKGAYLFGLMARGRTEPTPPAPFPQKEGGDGEAERAAPSPLLKGEGQGERFLGMVERLIPDVSVSWNASKHWYDVTNGTYLGEGASVKSSLDPHRATLLAALPYRVEKISLKLRRTDPAGAFKFTANIVAAGEAKSKEPMIEIGLHAFHLEIYDPQGRRLAHYAASAIAENGTWSSEIQLALNEPAGNYRMVLRDVISGTSIEALLLKDTSEYIEVKNK